MPDERYTTPFGKARIHRHGEDIVVVTWGAMVYTASEAAERLEDEDVSVEVLDLRTLIPWDREAVLEAARRTSKVLVLHEDTRTGGFGAEIAATIAEEAFEHLDAPGEADRRAGRPRSRSRRRSSGRSFRRSKMSSSGSGSSQRIDGQGSSRPYRKDRRGNGNADRGGDAPDGRLRLGGHDHEVAEAAG